MSSVSVVSDTATTLPLSLHGPVTARLRAAGCVFAADEARVLLGAAGDSAELAAMLRRRVRGEPLEVVRGWAWFRGVRIGVAPGVFVPRERSELVLRQAGSITGPEPVVVDLCCGSGALAAAVAYELDPAELHAADIDPVAVRCAAANLAGVGGRVYEGDLYDALPATVRGRVDLLLVNAPYVPTDSIALMPAEAREHEPRAALDGGPDGVDVHRRVARDAHRWLAPGGHLLLETSERQAPYTLAAVRRHGLVADMVHAADLDATVVNASAQR